MLIDPATGAVEFLGKIDLGSETTLPILVKEGYISALFVKQSTSGMLWIAEEVDEATTNAALECVKKNNPSFKACDAVAYGWGSHVLTYKKKKTATYTMSR